MHRLKYVLILTLGLLPVSALATNGAAQRDCDSNAVIYCGATSTDELITKLQKGDSRHSGAELQSIMNAQAISVDKLKSGDIQTGFVYSDGHVTAEGKRVATGAMSFGRQNLAGSTSAGSLWKRPTGASFQSDRLPAFIYMPGGRFAWAIIMNCGNPVVATPLVAVVPQVVQPQSVTVVQQTVVTPPPVIPQTGPSSTIPTPLIPLALLAGCAAWHYRSHARLRNALGRF